MSTSSIEWTDETWNPTTGCDRVSPGCDNCYALTMSARLKAMGQAKYQTDGRPETSGPGFGVQIHPDTLNQPLKWRKPRRVFVNSMSDLFHPHVPDDFIAAVWEVMGATPQHTYQILTKRPTRMRHILTAWTGARRGWFGPDGVDGPCDSIDLSATWPLPNVWLGTSVEDQERADQRVLPLLETPAAVRFLSCEPLLGPVDLSYTLDPEGFERDTWLNYLDWVIVGGESGPGARPMHTDWVRSLVQQCDAASVACFVKQMGSCPVGGPIHDSYRWPVTGKGGDPGEWPADLRVREFPEVVPT